MAWSRDRTARRRARAHARAARERDLRALRIRALCRRQHAQHPGPLPRARPAGRRLLRSRPEAQAVALRGLLPNGDMRRALAGERRTVPPAPTFDQAHTGDARHEVELGGPDVAIRGGADLQPAVTIPVLVRG